MVASHVLKRMKPSVKKGYWSQTWQLGLGSALLYVTVSRACKAKTERCQVVVAIPNPHYTRLLNEVFPEGETHYERTLRLEALAAAAGGEYKDGFISWQGRGSSTSDALSKAREVLARMGLEVETPERAA